MKRIFWEPFFHNGIVFGSAQERQFVWARGSRFTIRTFAIGMARVWCPKFRLNCINRVNIEKHFHVAWWNWAWNWICQRWESQCGEFPCPTLRHMKGKIHYLQLWETHVREKIIPPQDKRQETKCWTMHQNLPRLGRQLVLMGLIAALY